MMKRNLSPLLRLLCFALLSFLTPPLNAADELLVANEIINSIGMLLKRVDVGDFTMGTEQEPPKSRKEWNQRDWDESPAHPVKITKRFYMGLYEVTNKQYELFDAEHKKFRGKRGASKTDDEPVTYVTWQQAAEYCAWLSKKEDKPYRLPTEAEWEYACRAGTTTRFHTGDQLAEEQANLGKSQDGNPLTTQPVGSYPANDWGLQDMHGNVAEWCLDWYGPYEPGEQADPVGSSDGRARITRGWSFQHTPYQEIARFSRSANRSALLPEDANCYTGFRVVLAESPAGKPLLVERPLHEKDVKQTPAPTDGPDLSKPYFLNYTKSKTNPAIPADAWGPLFIHHNFYPTVCACPNGDLLAVWFTTQGESGRELTLAASRLRVGGIRWEPASLFFDAGDAHTDSPVLLSDGKRLYFLCVQCLRGWSDSNVIVMTSDDSGAIWSRPRIILTRDDPRAMDQVCSGFIGKNGEVVIAGDATPAGGIPKHGRFLVSKDRGDTWALMAGDLHRFNGGKYNVHPATLQLDDGTLLTFTRADRTPETKFMPRYVSQDLGETWERKLTPFPQLGVAQKPAAMKLASGAVLLIAADNGKKLGLGGGVIAALSQDGGKTWSHVRSLEGGAGGYMSVCQAADGVIYAFGGRMTCVAFNEAWLKEGKPVAEEPMPPPSH